MTAREKFTIGERVWLTREAKRCGVHANESAKSGIVSGFGRESVYVRIIPKGVKCARTYHMDFWEHRKRKL
jgi:hypothetical protein